jgi:hypothetical protein
MSSTSTEQPALPEIISPRLSHIIRNFAKDTRRLLKDNILAEYLFGSYATMQQTPLSDIDILIIVKRITPEMQWQMGGLASEYSLEYDVCLSPILQNIQVWEKNKRYHTLFYQEITQHGIPL